MSDSKRPLIIAFPTWKGGTGKTTIGAACIYILADRGYKILIIDLDSNLSMTNCYDCEGENFTSFELLTGVKGEPLSVTENIDIIPSNLLNSNLATTGENKLKTVLKSMDLSKYDYVFLDPPGTMTALTRTAIAAADKIIIPCLISKPDFNAVGLVISELEEMEVEADVSMVINRLELDKYDRDIFNDYHDNYNDYLYDEYITNMKSLTNLTKNVFKYALKGKAKKNIERFIDKVIM